MQRSAKLILQGAIFVSFLSALSWVAPAAVAGVLPPAAVPEPNTLSLVALGVVGSVLVARYRKRGK